MILTKKLLLNIGLILSLGLILFTGWIIGQSKSIINDAFLVKSKLYLSLVKETKKNEVIKFFNDAKQRLQFLTQDKMILEAFQDFKFAVDQINTNNHYESLKIDYFSSVLNQYYINWVKQYESYTQETNIIQDPNQIFSKFLPRIKPSTIYLQNKYINKVNLSSGLLTEYLKVHDAYHPQLQQLLQEYQYNDLLLIDFNGEVLYSVKKNFDFAASILLENFVSIELFKMFTQIKARAQQQDRFREPIISNFFQYLPDYQSPICIVATYIDKVGVLMATLRLTALEKLLELSMDDNMKIKLYLLDQDLRIVSQDDFGKTLPDQKLLTNIKLGEDTNIEQNNIKSFIQIPNTDLILVAHAAKTGLFHNIIKSLLSLFYYAIAIILIIVGLCYMLVDMLIVKTDDKLDHLYESMKNNIINKDFNHQIQFERKGGFPDKVAEIFNKLLALFQNILDQIVFKIKHFIEKHNYLLNGIKMIAQSFNREPIFFVEIKELTKQVENGIFQLQQETKQHYYVLEQQKNLFTDWDNLIVQNEANNVTVGTGMVNFNIIVNAISNICNIFENLESKSILDEPDHQLQVSMQNLRLLSIQQIKLLLDDIKEQVKKFKVSLENYMLNNDKKFKFWDKCMQQANQIKGNLDSELEREKYLSLEISHQLENLDQLQKKLLELELKYANFNKQLLEIVTNNHKLIFEGTLNDINSTGISY